jgi:hypothetical protein
MFRIDKDALPKSARDLIHKYDLTYRPAGVVELEEYVLNFLRTEDDACPRPKEQNRMAFERGWGENLELLKASSPEGYEAALKQKYYRGSKFFRYRDSLVVTDNLQLEYELSVIARLCLFHRYLRDAAYVYELGCGSCINLLLLSQLMPETRLIGFDWTSASSQIADLLGKKLRKHISGHLLDMLEPDSSVAIQENSAIISIHAFEQLGHKFEAILDFMVRSRPSIVVQYEPVLEFYNEDRLLDELALRYCRKRGILKAITRNFSSCKIREG